MTGNDDLDLDALRDAARRAAPRPDPAVRQAHLDLAARTFAALQAAAQEPAMQARPNRNGPLRAVAMGVMAMIARLGTRGALGAGTAAAALGLVMLTPAGQEVWRMPAPDLPVVSAEKDAAEAEAAVAAEAMPLAEAAPTAAAPAPMARALPPAPDMAMPAPAMAESFANAPDNPLRTVEAAPVSTFSVDVDTASWAIVRQSLNAGLMPPPDAVRIEEMVNYFPYDWPAPAAGDGPFRPTVTVMETPWNPDTRLVTIGLQAVLPDPADRPPLNLVFLIDTSGSMDDPAKLPLLKSAFRLLVDSLRPEDRVAIVTYAGSAGLVLPPTPARDAQTILRALQALDAGGGTAGQAGLAQAYAVARDMAAEGEAVTRVVLATDGDFNLGPSTPEELSDLIAGERDSGVFLSVLGFGRGNLNDAVMQALAQNGNGTAAYIDTLSEARKVLSDQVAGAMFPVASDVKVQVEFNPATVAEYRLIGYETRALDRADFNDDHVDAGEIGAGHSVTGIYEVTPVGSPAALVDPLRYQAEAPAGPVDELGFLRLRWKAPGEAESALMETPIPVATAPSDEAAFAAAIAGFGLLLRGEGRTGDWGWDDAAALATAHRGADPWGYRAEAAGLIRLAGTLSP